MPSKQNEHLSRSWTDSISKGFEEIARELEELYRYLSQTGHSSWSYDPEKEDTYMKAFRIYASITIRRALQDLHRNNPSLFQTNGSSLILSGHTITIVEGNAYNWIYLADESEDSAGICSPWDKTRYLLPRAPAAVSRAKAHVAFLLNDLSSTNFEISDCQISLIAGNLYNSWILWPPYSRFHRDGILWNISGSNYSAIYTKERLVKEVNNFWQTAFPENRSQPMSWNSENSLNFNLTLSNFNATLYHGHCFWTRRSFPVRRRLAWTRTDTPNNDYTGSNQPLSDDDHDRLDATTENANHRHSPTPPARDPFGILTLVREANATAVEATYATIGMVRNPAHSISTDMFRGANGVTITSCTFNVVAEKQENNNGDRKGLSVLAVGTGGVIVAIVVVLLIQVLAVGNTSSLTPTRTV
ncbi:hypothetical protein D9758_006991 [Tetrapyrgos nigripes]|uniref:Uncharacterized protein n=1 Tax=Tetrapyrgos nigripes TaxID=182062 RepID=A0A8H5LV03_9AGAR|nr:hypothetical protein D9758_006991 [Tetrapyrgos nigripes]